MPDFDGVHVDFDLGAHIAVPYGHAPVHYEIVDRSTGTTEASGFALAPDRPGEWSHLSTNRRYYVPWTVRLECAGKRFEHVMDLAGQSVIIDLRSALGDSIAWMRSVELFAEKHRCRTSVVMSRNYIPLFRRSHPAFDFIPREEWRDAEVPADCYARYICATDCMRPERRDFQPRDYRRLSVQACADTILGVDAKDEAPAIQVFGSTPRDDRLICIATRASAPCKEWHYDGGWETVVRALRADAFRVVCIDLDDLNLPDGAEDCTGPRLLTERAAMLKSARLFIGLPSGLSWLAFAVGTPHVLIDGMSDPAIEAPTPYVCTPPAGKCRNCWSFADQTQFPRYRSCFRAWDGYDVKSGQPTGRNGFNQYECTKSITPETVLATVRKALDETK